MSNLPIITTADYKTPADLAIALRDRKVAVPFVLMLGNEAWVIRNYKHGQWLLRNSILATAPGWGEGK